MSLAGLDAPRCASLQARSDGLCTVSHRGGRDPWHSPIRVAVPLARSSTMRPPLSHANPPVGWT